MVRGAIKKEIAEMTKQQGTRIVEARNRGEAMAYGNRDRALDILAKRPTWAWLLPGMWGLGFICAA